MSFDTFYSYDEQFDEPFYNKIDPILKDSDKFYNLQYINNCDEKSNYDPQLSHPCKKNNDEDTFLISKDIQQNKKNNNITDNSFIKEQHNKLLNQIEHFNTLNNNNDINNQQFDLNKLKLFIMCFLIGIIIMIIVNIWFKIQIKIYTKNNVLPF